MAGPADTQVIGDIGERHEHELGRRRQRDGPGPGHHPNAHLRPTPRYRAYFCQLTGRSKITAYRHERVDPLWPRPLIRGGRVFYKAVDCKRYLMSARAQEFKL